MIEGMAQWLDSGVLKTTKGDEVLRVTLPGMAQYDDYIEENHGSQPSLSCPSHQMMITVRQHAII